MITLIKGKIYIVDAMHNALRDNEANLPGVPPDAQMVALNCILAGNYNISHTQKGQKIYAF